MLVGRPSCAGRPAGCRGGRRPWAGCPRRRGPRAVESTVRASPSPPPVSSPPMAVGTSVHLRGADAGLRGPVRPAAAPDPPRAGRPLRGPPARHRRRLPGRARAHGAPRPRRRHRVPADRRHAGRAEGPPAAARATTTSTSTTSWPSGRSATSCSPACSSARRSRTPPPCSRRLHRRRPAARYPRLAGLDERFVDLAARPAGRRRARRTCAACLRAVAARAASPGSTSTTWPPSGPAWPTPSRSWSTSCPGVGRITFRRLTGSLVERSRSSCASSPCSSCSSRACVELDQAATFGDIARGVARRRRRRDHVRGARVDRRLRGLTWPSEVAPRHRGDRDGGRGARRARPAGPAARAARRRGSRSSAPSWPLSYEAEDRGFELAGWPAATASRATPTWPPTSSASCSRASRPGCRPPPWRPWRSSPTSSRSPGRQVAAIRGVNVDGGHAHAQQRGYIAEVGPRPRARPGRALRHHRDVPRAARPRLARRPARRWASSCPGAEVVEALEQGLRLRRRATDAPAAPTPSSTAMTPDDA